MKVEKYNILTQLNDVSNKLGELIYRLGDSIYNLSELSSLPSNDDTKYESVGPSTLNSAAIELSDNANRVRKVVEEQNFTTDRFEIGMHVSQLTLGRLVRTTNILVSDVEKLTESIKDFENFTNKIESSQQKDKVSEINLNLAMKAFGFAMNILGKATKSLSKATSAILST